MLFGSHQYASGHLHVVLKVSGIPGSAALAMEDALKAEYGLLYKRHLLHERRLGQTWDGLSFAPHIHHVYFLADDLSELVILTSRGSFPKGYMAQFV